MNTNIGRFPSRAEGAWQFHSCLERLFEQHAYSKAIGADLNGSGSRFVAAAAELKGPALDGFLYAAGWWIEVAIKAGPVSPEEFSRILRDAGIVAPGDDA